MGRRPGTLVGATAGVFVFVSLGALIGSLIQPASPPVLPESPRDAAEPPHISDSGAGRLAVLAAPTASQAARDRSESGLGGQPVNGSSDDRGSQRSMFGDDDEGRSVLAVWDSERANSPWTTEVRDYTSMAMADARVPADRLLGVDCRETLCRVRYRFPDVAEAAALRNLRNPDTELRVFPDPAGLGIYSVFIAKDAGALAPQRFSSSGAAGQGGLND